VPVAAAAANNVRYFRRSFRPSVGNGAGCVFNSNVVTVTTSGAAPVAPWEW
jgi:hypothetical protein